MARLLVSAALSLSVLFALALVVLRFPATPAAPSPAAWLDACEAPCWEGVQPGVTSRAEGLARLSRANGSEPSREPCYIPGDPFACDLYQWKLADDAAIRAGMQVEHEIVRLITAQPADVTLGEALLMLRRKGQPLYEFQVGYDGAGTLFLWLAFAESRVSMTVAIECPTTYRALMHAPIVRVVLQEPDQRRHAPATFNTVRDTIYHLCEV
jgi:hypothetical protein